MDRRLAVLFVVQNDHFPQDARVFNECRAVSRMATCWVMAPRAAGQPWRESMADAECLRYPCYMANSLRGIPLEYLISLFWMAVGIPLLVFLKGIRVVHVANPPDFILPAVAWLKIFGVKLVYDMHDVSTETLRAKLGPRPGPLKHALAVLQRLESWSLKLCDLMVATNESILARATQQHPALNAVVVRNSHRVVHSTLEEIDKAPPDGRVRIGYFGLLADDEAAGLENMVLIAAHFRERQCPFVLQIVGTGPGLGRLMSLVEGAHLQEHFEYLGFIPMPQAYRIISQFDFGLVAWGDLPKNHLHTAMKIMDYMCCAVPVCSINLREQLRSTGGVGVHADDFITLAERMLALREDAAGYEALRRRTLTHFNEHLSWGLQQDKLIQAYSDMLARAAKTSIPC